MIFFSDKIFGEKTFPSSLDMNKRYGGGEPIASKVFYSDFSDDPWQRASVTYPVSSDQPYHLTTCDNCGHCLDLHQPYEDDPQALKDGRQEFEVYLKKWLTEASVARAERKLQPEKENECLSRGTECFKGEQCCSGRCSGDGVEWTCA